jgi:hypothetical protein
MEELFNIYNPDNLSREEINELGKRNILSEKYFLGNVPYEIDLNIICSGLGII